MSELLEKSRKRLIMAKIAYNLEEYSNDYMYDIICFDLQQSIEMSLKFVLEITANKNVRTHDITILLESVEKIDFKFTEKELLFNMSDTLTVWETKSRYKDGFKTTKYNIDRAIRLAESMIEDIENYIKEQGAKNNMNSFN